ncbi:hypothetical protein, partial [Pseudomonas helleri]|uniref:hypothetical protein n=1 Tax=Pseudomonas helleri TaxID=1608996 RepID=UPI0019D3D583
QAEALGTTDLNGGALFNAEFGIRHRGSTVPERSGVALSFCRRPINKTILGTRGGVLSSLNMSEIKKIGAMVESKKKKGAIHTPTPRILIVARANSRYTSST